MGGGVLSSFVLPNENLFALFSQSQELIGRIVVFGKKKFPSILHLNEGRLSPRECHRTTKGGEGFL